MGLWTDRLLPRVVDRSLSTSDVVALRREVCSGLRGRVLEIGFGSGLNLPHLPHEVDSLDAVEPSDTAWRLSLDRRTASRVPVARTGLDGQRIQAEDASYDAVLSTFSLCTIPDVATALTEVRRVLRPGGRLHLLEHGAAPDADVARRQRRLEPLQKRVFGGCHLTRDVRALVEQAGLDLVDVDQHYLPGPALMRPWGYLTLGRALPR